jgi:hypothetical protein
MNKHFLIVVMAGALLLGGCGGESDSPETGDGPPLAGDMGTCFYVSATGDNANNGFTENTPFKTLVKAYGSAAHHATRKRIIVLSSLASESTVLLTPYLFQEETVTIEGKGEGITITRNGGTNGTVLEIAGGAIVRFENIRIDGKVNGGTNRALTIAGTGVDREPQTVVTLGNGVVITGKRTSSGTSASGTVDVGSGIFVLDGARLVMDYGSTVTGCEGTYTCSVAVYGSLLVINEGASISDNTRMSGSGGGIIYIYQMGAVEMNGGAIHGNEATGPASHGGGVFVQDGTFTMNGGEISGNKANRGGGVYVQAGTFTMNGGKISGNEATERGGGVCFNLGWFAMNGGTIYGNGAVTGVKNTAGTGAAFYSETNGTATINGAALDTTDDTITVP